LQSSIDRSCDSYISFFAREVKKKITFEALNSKKGFNPLQNVTAKYVLPPWESSHVSLKGAKASILISDCVPIFVFSFPDRYDASPKKSSSNCRDGSMPLPAPGVRAKAQDSAGTFSAATGAYNRQSSKRVVETARAGSYRSHRTGHGELVWSSIPWPASG
jgi:hypothetical protein